MNPFKVLLAATDFSVDGNNAVRRAALLAHMHGSQLHILHVLNGDGCEPLRDWFKSTIDLDLKASLARDALRRVAVEICGAYDVAPTVEVVVGPPFETLLRAAELADLVVVGQRGRRRFGGLLLNGTADRMVRLCRCPVLVIRTPVEQAYRRVLVPFDFTASSDAAVRLAAQIGCKEKVQVFHAIDSQLNAVLRDADVPAHIIRGARTREETDTHARMRCRVSGLGLDVTAMNFATAHGAPVGSTLREAKRYGAELLIVGKQDRSTMGAFLLGNVSGRLTSEASCDVLMVPKPLKCSRLCGEATAKQAATRAARLDAPAECAYVARSLTRPPEATSHGNWMHNAARFSPRRNS